MFQGTQLLPHQELGSSEWQQAYSLDEVYADDVSPEDTSWIVFAEDNEYALITNLRNPKCPFYLLNGEDSDATLIAPNFATGFHLLGYWLYLYESYFDLKYANLGLPEKEQWKGIIQMFQAKLDELAPGCTADQWHFW